MKQTKYEWIDIFKGLAIIGIIINHFVEELQMTGLHIPGYINILSQLGDHCPGIFIFLSGLGLSLSSENKNPNWITYLKTRFLKIFPLYICAHLFFNIFCYIFKLNYSLFSNVNIISLLGLRFTPSLFYYLNPSWWFIGLIIQLYIIFPILYKLKKINPFLLLAVSLSFNVISTLIGGVFFENESLAIWDRGLFFGTRIFEFSMGIFISNYILNIKLKRFDILIYTSIISCLFISTIIWGNNLFNRFFNNIFTTIGLLGFFIIFYSFIKKLYQPKNKFLTSFGYYSFSIFLIHQPFLKWSNLIIPLNNKIGSMIISLFISIIIGIILQFIIQKIIAYSKTKFHLIVYLVSTFIIIIIISQIFSLLNNNTPSIKLFKFCLLGILLLIPFYIFTTNPNNKILYILVHVFSLSVIFFILPPNWNITFIPLILFIFITVYLLYYFLKNLLISILISTFLSLIIILSIEFINYKVIPNEQWSELPILKPDSETTWGLKPNLSLKLNYRYHYTIQTNSYGLIGKEINYSCKNENNYRIFVIGDAFTMPEALNYTESYPYLLEQKLNQGKSEKKFEVINGGVTGFGPKQSYNQLLKYFNIIKPNLVIYQFFINEFEDVMKSDKSFLNEIGLSKSNRIEKQLQNAFLPNYIINKITRKNKIKLPEIDYNNLLQFYEKNNNIYNANSVSLVRRYLIGMKTFCDKNNCKLLVLFVPGQIVISKKEFIDYYPKHINLHDTSLYDLSLPNKKIKSICTNLLVPFIDSSDTLRNHNPQPVYYPYYWHWNQEGHKVISSFLYKKLKYNF
jgi:peptidoglycan/LPS O-acetylase OafA/YrhL